MRLTKRIITLAALAQLRAHEAIAASCAACAQHRAPRLFVMERGDGPGATLHSLLYALGVASRYGMTLGGVKTRDAHISHSINITHLAMRILGLQASTFVRNLPLAAINVSSVAKLDAMHAAGDLKDGGSYRLTPSSLIKDQGLEGVRLRRNTSLDEFLTPSLLDRLRTEWASSPTFERPGTTTMAVHVRRGTRHKALTPDIHFLRLIDVMTRVSARTEVHVYSLRDARIHLGFNATPYERRGALVHLDRSGHGEEDIVAIWAHLAQARVLVVDTSSFSWLPAFFNPHCVIYHPYRIHRAQDRLVLASWVPSDDLPRVEACMRRALLLLP